MQYYDIKVRLADRIKQLGTCHPEFIAITQQGNPRSDSFLSEFYKPEHRNKTLIVDFAPRLNWWLFYFAEDNWFRKHIISRIKIIWYVRIKHRKWTKRAKFTMD